MQPKINYDKEMTNIISQLKDHKKLLLHAVLLVVALVLKD